MKVQFRLVVAHTIRSPGGETASKALLRDAFNLPTHMKAVELFSLGQRRLMDKGGTLSEDGVIVRASLEQFARFMVRRQTEKLSAYLRWGDAEMVDDGATPLDLSGYAI